MYREKRSENEYSVDGSTRTADMKAIALDFAENLLALIDGEVFDSIITNAEDKETKLYINLLPLFEDVSEIIKRQIAVSEINENNEIHIIADLIYLSKEMEKKEKRIEYKLYLQSNDYGGYDIIAAV